MKKSRRGRVTLVVVETVVLPAKGKGDERGEGEGKGWVYVCGELKAFRDTRGAFQAFWEEPECAGERGG
ncbi:hypothetical protein M0804_001210 [Polistes exclamans]|nr:hypothetical protein M0804_001210 [Polistes exclamans]